MGAKLKKSPFADNMKQFTDLFFSGSRGDLILAVETE